MKRDIQRYAAARDMSAGEFVRYCIWTYMDQTEAEDAEDALAREEHDAGLALIEQPLEIGEIRRG